MPRGERNKPHCDETPEQRLLGEIVVQLRDLNEKVGCIMSPEVTRIVEEVTELKTVNASVKALLSKLSAAILTHIDDKAALRSIATDMDTENATAAAAVLEHTPAETTEPPVNP